MSKHQQTGFLARFLRVASAVALTVGAAAISGQAVAGIANTKHNLGSTGTAGNNKVTETQDICVFCHTPHGADISTVGAPLWNKRLPTGAALAAYQTYSSSTLDSTKATDGGGGGVGSTSIACLSCHDGTQAMDNIINAPGSGGYDSTGGGTTGLAWTWTNVGTRVDSDGKLLSSNVANLGQDLRNDHPIAIMYCGGPATGTTMPTSAASCKDVDFKDLSTTGGAYYVDTNANSTRDKGDMILFNRTFTVNGTANTANMPSVECGSCHDPHRERFAANQVNFMRVTTVGSQICLSCHVK